MTSARVKLRRGERGSATVELVLVVPALVLVLGLLVAGGRLWFARATVAEAAQAAARAASLTRTAGEAGQAGRDAANQSMATGGLTCADQSAQVDTGAFGIEVGTPATVTATVQCRVPFADIVLPGMPGSIALSSTGRAALDTYRARE